MKIRWAQLPEKPVVHILLDTKLHYVQAVSEQNTEHWVPGLSYLGNRMSYNLTVIVKPILLFYHF